jgi:hypothetical protein
MSNKNIPEFLIKNYIKIKTPEERKKFIKTFEFLDFICSNFKINLDKDFISNFIENDNFLELEIINKKIFDLAQEKSKNKIQEISSFKLDENILNVFRNLTKRTIADLEYTKADHFNELKRLETASIELSKKILSVNEKIKNGNETFILMISNLIEKMIDYGKFSDINFNTTAKTINFITKDNILIPYNDEFVNIGRFIICLSVENFLVRIVPFENNLNSSEFIHFHVFANGTVCFGNALASYNQFVADKNLVNIITTTMQILQNYNPASPTIPIDSLISASKGGFDFSTYQTYCQTLNLLQGEYYKKYSDYNGYGLSENPNLISIWKSSVKNDPRIESQQIDLAVQSLDVNKKEEPTALKVVSNFKKKAISFI